ncbi:hypothetical protein EJB05_04133, partial [Eragrostis curvula]
MSTAGFKLCPQSYTRSLRRIVVAPVSTSTSTCDEVCNVSALAKVKVGSESWIRGPVCLGR